MTKSDTQGTSGTKCRVCGTRAKLLADHSNPSGIRSICGPCNKERLKAYRQKNRKASKSTAPMRHDAPILTPKSDEQLLAQIRVILAHKKSKPWSVEGLADHFDVSPRRVRESLERLDDAHINLRESSGGGYFISPEIPPSEPTVIPLASLKGKEHLFGLTADNHLCSKYARMDVLNALFDIWADRGVKTVYQCGNMIDGEARFNKGDIVAFGLDAQVDYFVQHWPQRKGITTYFITGDDHEGWYTQREQINVGKHIQNTAREAGRTDLVFLGHMEHDIILRAEKGDAVMRLIHAGGGSAYATSYAPQKIVESYSGGEKPQILLVGHYHKAEYGYPREVHTVQAAATQQQSPFMRKNKLQSHLGGWTIRFEQSSDGLIHAFTPTFDPFYNREFYTDKQWKYHWGQAA